MRSASAAAIVQYREETSATETDLGRISAEQPDGETRPERETNPPKTSTETPEGRPYLGRTSPPVVHLKITTRNAIRPIAEWQGYVTKIEGDHFLATMEGIFGSSILGQRHEAVIPFNEISPDDRNLVKEGAYFRLSIAYTITRGGTGTSTRQSTIVFRRLPAYRASDIEIAKEIAKELIRGIRLE